MPKLHINGDTGTLQIVHKVRRWEEGDAGIRTFGVSDEAAAILEEQGYEDQSSIPHELFHRLLEKELIWAGREPTHTRADSAFQVSLTAAVKDYFDRLQEGSIPVESIIEVFRIDILSQVMRIRNAQLKREMLSHVADTLQRSYPPLVPDSNELMNTLKSLLYRRTPVQWRQGLKAFLGSDFVYMEDGLAESEAADERAPSGSPPANPHHMQESLAASEVNAKQAELRGFERLSQDYRDWVISCCAKFPGVDTRHSTDPVTGEIQFVFNGLPPALVQNLIDAALGSLREPA